MTDGAVDTPAVFAPARWRKWLVVIVTVVFDVVIVAIGLGVGVFFSDNIAALVVCALLAVGATVAVARLFRSLDRRVEVTSTELRVLQGDRQAFAIPRSQLGKVRIWYHAARFAGQPKGMFAWDTEGRPVAYVALILSPGQWEGLVAEIGVPAPPLHDDERRWIIRHPVPEGGTGGLGMTVLDRLAEPLIRPGWYAARDPSEGLDGRP